MICKQCNQHSYVSFITELGIICDRCYAATGKGGNHVSRNNYKPRRLDAGQRLQGRGNVVLQPSGSHSKPAKLPVFQFRQLRQPLHVVPD